MEKYFIRFMIVDTTTGETRTKESEKYGDINEALNIMESYIHKQKNYIDIKRLGNNKVKIEKFGGYIECELVTE